MYTDGDHTDLDHINEFRERFHWSRPQMICLSENQGRYFLSGSPTDVNRLWLPEGTEYTDWLLLSDHNRESLPVNTERIGSNRRMINGNMRSYFIADKISISLSWTELPSRAYSTLGGYTTYKNSPDSCQFTVDGGAGGLQMSDWYQGHKGSMWVFLSYDNIASSSVHGSVPFKGYGRVYEMMITEFNYDVKRRGGTIQSGSDIYAIDLWDVDMSLEEV